MAIKKSNSACFFIFIFGLKLKFFRYAIKDMSSQLIPKIRQ